MEITLNSQNITVKENEILENILESHHLLAKKGIAVAINSSVIPKNKWNETKLNTNDNIMVITATAGG